MELQNALFWIWLAEALGAGNRDVKRLLQVYDGPYAVYHAEDGEIAQVEGISDSTKAKLQSKSLERASQILDLCERQSIGILPYTHADFPSALREIKDPPLLLYYSGTLQPFDRRLCIGMVGTRRMSAYGLRSAYKIAYELASVDALVVSGMASGIDGVAAAAALAAKAPTVAVLGCGLDIVYPKHHGILMEQIRKNGLLLSEYPPATTPNRYHFPVRNRLISGLTQGTVVVEAGIGSGSLITAKDAVQQGRKVFAVPANLGSRGADGTNGLIRDGASLILSAADIIKYYAFTHAETLRTELLPKAEKASEADLQYLDRMGVIELTRRTAGPSQPHTVVQAVPEERETKKPQKKAADKARNTSAKPKKPLPAQDSEPEQLSLADLPTAAEPRPREPVKAPENLSPIQLAIFEAIPDDRAVAMDALTALDYSSGDLIAALTMLEIMGLIHKLPGGMYMKA